MSDPIIKPELTEYLTFIHQLAGAAAKETLTLFRQPIDVDNKGSKMDQNFDPVTAADRNAEAAMRALIQTRYPGHDIIGEEGGQEQNGPESWVDRWQWVLDPIDGTRAFISGIPLWGTLIALNDGNGPVLGMMDQPYLGERYFGNEYGSFLSRYSPDVSADPAQTTGQNLKPIGVRPCPSLAQATLSTTDPTFFPDQNQITAFETVAAKSKLVRNGYDCYAYCMVAMGQMDLVIESGLAPYDIQALIPIIEGAGGIVTNWTGGSPDQGGHVIAAGDPRVHAEALDILQKAVS